MTEYTHVWKRMSSGKYVNLVTYSKEDVHLMDIMTALTHIIRFDGHHTHRTPLNVLQHSVLTHDLAEEAGEGPYVRLAALIHDAHEAIIGDNSTPTKMLTGMKEPEHIKNAVREFFGVTSPPKSWVWAWVKKYDLLALEIERKSIWNVEPGDEMYWPPETGMLETKARAIFRNFRNVGVIDFITRLNKAQREAGIEA